MFKHLFKLIWNKRKRNFLLLLEILVSFMVLFSVFTLVIYKYRNYKKDMGFESGNVWVINYNNQQDFSNSDSMTLFYETFRKSLKEVKGVTDISFSGENFPFSPYTNGTWVEHSYKKMVVNGYKVEDSYDDVLNIKVLEGRWFGEKDLYEKNKPVVITASLKETLFGDGPAVGQVIDNYDGAENTGKGKSTIIGVVFDLKDKGDFQPSGNAIFNKLDTSAFRWLHQVLVKVSPDADAGLENRLYKVVNNWMKNSNVTIEILENKRKAMNSSSLMPAIVMSIVSFFLVINVALGLFGVLWYNIRNRRSEIGLRRAIGATGRSVSSQLVAESVIMATFSLIIGIFFAIQFPLLKVFGLPTSVYIVALLAAIAFIYLLVLICSLYPGRQAAAVYPAIALHEE